MLDDVGEMKRMKGGGGCDGQAIVSFECKEEEWERAGRKMSDAERKR